MTTPEGRITEASFFSVSKTLHQCIEDLTNPSNALLCTSDGMALLSAKEDSEASARGAALTSALFSLSSSFCSELLGSENRELALTTIEGHAVIVAFNVANRDLFLCCTSSAKTNLAMLMRTCKDAAEKIKTTLEFKQTGEKDDA